LGKGSGRRPLLISETEAEYNCNKIFVNKKVLEEILIDKEWDEMKPVGKEILAEYELNKSTGEVEKRFKDGFEKPNESQFDGDKPNAVKP
jgi:hypothetical protein